MTFRFWKEIRINSGFLKTKLLLKDWLQKIVLLFYLQCKVLRARALIEEGVTLVISWSQCVRTTVQEKLDRLRISNQKLKWSSFIEHVFMESEIETGSRVVDRISSTSANSISKGRQKKLFSFLANSILRKRRVDKVQFHHCEQLLH